MIVVQLNRRDFEYDIHSLVKAFYPGEDVGVYLAGELPEIETQLKISVFFEEKQIRAVFEKRGADAEAAGEDASESPGGRTQPEKVSESPSCRTQSEDVSESPTCRTQPEKVSESPAHRAENMREDSVPITDWNDRPEVKNQLKSLLYHMLVACTDKALPWGDLTGIRPVKIAMHLMEEGYSNAQIARYMRERYFVSIPKSALAVEIANREKHLLKQLDYRNGYSLYVGIPFCPSICLYCSFSSSPLAVWKNQVDDYLEALFKEMDAAADSFAGRQLQTVYIGGGTPTTLEPSQMDRLLTQIETHFDLSGCLEFTVEAGRPDSITQDKLQVLREHGISRISINPQTMNQQTLDIIGRRHTVEEIIDTFHLARQMGFDNINTDLIVGLPAEGVEEVRHTMEEIAALDPDSVTVHSLALKRATRLHLMKDQYEEISFTNSTQIMDMTADYCRKQGLDPYYLYRQKNMAGNFENVGYAKDGKACLYNILIMEEVQSILALGAGASTKLVFEDGRIERIENVKDIRNYIDRIDEMIERKRRIRHG